MKNFFITLRNIFFIKDLRTRLFNTLALVSIYLAGRLLLLPGIDASIFEHNSSGVIAWLDRLLGSSLKTFSVFSLGIYPYISASIAIQFLSITFPYFQRLQKEGASGKNKLNQITRLLALIITPLEAIPYLYSPIRHGTGLLISKYYFVPLAIILLTAGTMFCIFLADRITEKGLGNGSSMLIMSGILSSLPNAFAGELSQVSGMLLFVIELTILFLITLIIISVTRGVRRIPLQRAKQMLGGHGVYRGRREYLPIQVNSAGVMPVIMASMISAAPRLVGHLLRNKSDLAANIAQIMSDENGWQYNLVLAIIVFASTYFYVAIFINPTEIAGNLRRENAFIPGVKPGRDTAGYIDSILTKITLFGSLFLALIAVVPAFAFYFGVTKPFSKFFGGTYLIILTGTILELVRQIESHLFMRHYNDMVENEQTIPEL